MFKLTVYYDSWCPFCQKISKGIKKFDWFDLIELRSIREMQNNEISIPFNELEKEMHCSNPKTHKITKGIDAIASLCARLPLFMILWIPLKLSSLCGFGKVIYRYIARNRKIVPVGHCNVHSCDRKIL